MNRFIAIFLTVLLLAITGCGSSSPTSSSSCGTHNGETLHLGPQDGCYYINSNGNKTYVDRSECNC